MAPWAPFSAAPVPEEVERCRDLISAARERGMEVMVTLVRFALPPWVHDLDDPEIAAGLEDPAIAERFAAWPSSASPRTASRPRARGPAPGPP